MEAGDSGEGSSRHTGATEQSAPCKSSHPGGGRAHLTESGWGRRQVASGTSCLVRVPPPRPFPTGGPWESSDALRTSVSSSVKWGEVPRLPRGLWVDQVGRLTPGGI